MKHTLLSGLIAFLSLILLPGLIATAQADTHSWTGNGTPGDWSDANNWDLGVPASGDDVIFGNGGNITIVNIGRTEPRHISIEANTTLILGETRLITRGDLTVNSGIFDINENDLRLGGKVYISGGTLLMSGATTTLKNNVEITSGTLNLENGTIIFFESNLTYSGGTFTPGTGTVQFEGETSSYISSTLDISIYRLVVDMSDWDGLFSLTGNGNTVFTILNYAQINNYDSYYNDPPITVSQAYISYANGASLRYNRSAGIPATGDEWPASNMPKIVFMEGEVTLNGTKSNVDTVIVQNGSVVGTLGYSAETSLLSYYPNYSANITIGSEWPTLDGPASLSINNSGYSVIGYDNVALTKNLTIETGTLNLNNKTITVLGSVSGSTISGNGALADGTTLVLGNQTFTNYGQTISGSISFDDINIDKSGGATEAANTVTFSNQMNLRSGSNLTLTNGTLDFNAQSPVLAGSNQLINSGTVYTGGASLNGFSSIYSTDGNLVFDGTISETIPSGFSVANLTLNNEKGAVTSTGTLTVLGELELTQGLLTTTSTNTLLMDENSTVNQHIATSFVHGPLQKAFSAAGSFSYPIGHGDVSRPATFAYSYFNGVANSVIELSYFHNTSFSTGDLPDGISEADPTGHFIMKETGTAPDSMAYSLTLPFTNENFLPENRNRILVQQSGTPTWLVGNTDATNDVDTTQNTVTMKGMSDFPTNSGMLILGKGNQLVVFNGTEDLNWFNANNWSTGSLPTTVDDIVVDENTTLVLGDNDSNSGTETPLQSIASLTIKSGSKLSIDTTNTATTSLLIGSGLGSDTVLTVVSGGILEIDGGSFRSIALKNGSQETMLIDGSVLLTDGAGFGSGTGGLALETSRQNWTPTSKFTFGLSDNGDFQPQTYGELNLSLQNKMVLNANMNVTGDFNILKGNFIFVEGNIADKTFIIEGDLNVLNDAFARTCLPNTGNHVFSLKGDLNVDPGAAFYNDNKATLELSGDSTQTMGESITNVDKLRISGSGEKILTSDLTIRDSLTIEGGLLNTKGKTITIGTGTDHIGSLSFVNNTTPSKISANSDKQVGSTGFFGQIYGKVLRWVPAQEIKDMRFPIKSGNNVKEVRLSFSASTNGGLISTEYKTIAPEKNGFPLTDSDGTVIKNILPDGYWTVKPLSGLDQGSYSIELATDQLTGVSDASEIRIIKRENDTQPWELLGSHDTSYVENGYLVVRRKNLNGFSDFTISGSESNTLPVELSKFEGFIESAGVPTLRWTTATERENYGFHIERSDQPIDISPDTTWNKIAFVEGNGTVTEERSYSYTDNSATLNGTYLYRLIQEDYDGTKTTHDTLSVKVELATQTGLSSVYPNPFNPQATVAFSVDKSQTVKINLYNVLGQRVRILANTTFEAGNHTLRLNASNLSSGTYLLVMQADGRQHVKKISLIE